MRSDAEIVRGQERSDQPAPEETAAAAGESTPAAGTLPLWFEAALVIAVAAVVSFGACGMLFAVLGRYHPGPVLLLGSLGTAAVALVAWPRRPALRPERVVAGVTLPAIGMCLVAGGFAAWNGLYAGHHVAIGRDPGVYAVTGKWMATDGTLAIPTGPEWSAKDPGARVETLGLYAEDGSRLEFQFSHLTSVLLAEADNIGGDRLMFRVPALLGGLALCAVYAVGCLLVRRPWLVLAAVTALALSLP